MWFLLFHFLAHQAWLNKNIHEKGSVYKSGDEILTAVTGEPLNVSIFLKYLRTKYEDLYSSSSK